ncbi:MAG: NAD(P)H-dependent oxidoreductase, partial [Synechococcaceae cyanobacterium]|nr:NAD(P)H-dependent oxidoreductase [Synechococcaceae cyanobacterium]
MSEAMKILIILAHPDSNSLNHSIAHAIRDDLLNEGHDVIFHDLCEEGFSPLLTAEEIPESGEMDHVVKA